MMPHALTAYQLPTGSYNEAEAYLYFSRACLEYLRQSGRQPDVLHVHEWQASAVPMLVSWLAAVLCFGC